MYLFLVAEKYLSRTGKSDGNCAYFWAIIVGFFVAIFTFARSIAFRVTKGIQDSETGSSQNPPKMAVDSIVNEEFRPPSPAPRFTEAELLSSASKRLCELEEKVDILNSKPNIMPYEKEELLNAAVYRVDALEAELIATKKVFHLKSCYFFLARQTAILSAYSVSNFDEKVSIFCYYLPINWPVHQLLTQLSIF